LITFFESLIDVAGHDEQLPPLALTQYLALLFTIPSTDFLVHYQQRSITDFFIFYNLILRNNYLEILPPPPRA
jgi:hypothetical protein